MEPGPYQTVIMFFVPHAFVVAVVVTFSLKADSVQSEPNIFSEYLFKPGLT